MLFLQTTSTLQATDFCERLEIWKYLCEIINQPVKILLKAFDKTSDRITRINAQRSVSILRNFHSILSIIVAYLTESAGPFMPGVCHSAAEIFNFNQLCKLKISVKPKKSILALLVVSRLQDWFQIEFSQHWFWGLQISTDNPVGNSRSTSPSVSIKVLEQQLERPGVVTNLLSEIHIYVYLSYILAVSIDRNPINGNISNGTTVSLTFMNHGQRYSHTSFWIRSRRCLSIQETTPYSTGRPLWLGDSCWCWAKS